MWGRNTGKLSPEVSLPHPGTSRFHLSKSYQNKHLIKNCKTHESKISLRRDGQETDKIPSMASDVVVSEYRCKIATYDLFKEIKWECGSLYMDMRQVKND